MRNRKKRRMGNLSRRERERRRFARRLKIGYKATNKQLLAEVREFEPVVAEILNKE